MTEQPTSYSIESLLNSGVQPLPDLEDDELDALGAALGRGPLAVPIAISSDGILLDGHQRLKTLLRQGRKRIVASDVRVVQQAHGRNALEWAIRLNVQRRHLSTDQKADLARRLQRERNWSQTRIAKVFGVSQPAVSQWLARDEDYEPPSFTVGEDGKQYPSLDFDRPRVRPEKEPRNEWRPDGAHFKAVRRAYRVLRDESLGDLGPLQLARVGELLGDLIEAATALQGEVADRS